MFIAYTDASIIKNIVYLGLRIQFEDDSIINRRILASKMDINTAEAFAILELINFLEYYGFNRGSILIDSANIINGLKNKKGKFYKSILYQFEDLLEKLEVKIQLVPTKSNKAHQISNRNEFKLSSVISTIDRNIYSGLEGYKDYYLSFDAYKSYKELTNNSISFSDVHRKLNKRIFIGELVYESENNKEYAFYDLRIKVSNDTIISFSKVNYVIRKHHWRAMKKIKKFRRYMQRSRSIN